MIDLLADLPIEELRKMREANRVEHARLTAELARVTVEGSQFDEAIDRIRKSTSDTKPRITKQMIFNAIKGIEPPVGVADVGEALESQGFSASPNAIRNHLNRLVTDGNLVQVDGGYLVKPTGSFIPAVAPASTADFPSSPSDNDIPF